MEDADGWPDRALSLRRLHFKMNHVYLIFYEPNLLCFFLFENGMLPFPFSQSKVSSQLNNKNDWDY